MRRRRDREDRRERREQRERRETGERGRVFKWLPISGVLFMAGEPEGGPPSQIGKITISEGFVNWNA